MTHSHATSNRFCRAAMCVAALAMVTSQASANLVLGINDGGPNDLDPTPGVVKFDFSQPNHQTGAYTLYGELYEDLPNLTVTLTNLVYEVPTGMFDRKVTLTYVGMPFPGPGTGNNLRTTAEVNGLAIDADGDGNISHVEIELSGVAINSGGAQSKISTLVSGATVPPGGSVPFSDGPNLSATQISIPSTSTGNLTFTFRMFVHAGDRLELPSSFHAAIIPEPGTAALIGLAGVAALARRPRRRQA